MRIAAAATPLPRLEDMPQVQASPTSSPVLVVDVEGEVRHPGLHKLRIGTRVAAAIDAAGGLTAKADVAAIDRAEVLEDGKEVLVPAQGSTDVARAGMVDSNAPRRVRHTPRGGHRRHRRHHRAAATPAPPTVSQDLNSASEAALAKLPGLDPILAGRIVALRAIDGRFDSLDDLLDVNGMNDARLRRISQFLRVASSSP